MATKKLSEMTDEERYGKVGAAIRRLDPEAYKNRPRSMEGNLKLLKELREKNKETPARVMSADEFMAGVGRRQEETSKDSEPVKYQRGPQNPRRYPGQGAAQRQAERASAAMERNKSRLPSDRATGFRTQAEETGLNEDERADKAREYAANIAMTAGAARLGSVAGAPYARTAGQFRKAADEASEKIGRALSRRGVPSQSERYAAGESAAARRAEFKRRKELSEAMGRFRDEKEAASRLSRGAVYNKGGSVKRYAGGGSVSSASRRADGIAQRGKTRGKYV
jgi:hypothetical protein